MKETSTSNKTVSLFSSMTLTNITYVTAHVSLSRLKMIYYKLLNLLVVITHLDMLVFLQGTPHRLSNTMIVSAGDPESSTKMKR